MARPGLFTTQGLWQLLVLACLVVIVAQLGQAIALLTRLVEAFSA